MIDDDTASFVAQAGAYVVPTMAIFFPTADYGHMRAKIDLVVGRALESLQRMRKAQTKLGE